MQTRKRIVGRGEVRVGVRDSTIATYHRRLNTFFIWLHANNHIDNNPLENIKRPTENYDDKRALEKSDIEKIYAGIILNTKNPLIMKRDTLIVSILFFTGLRKSELTFLQVRDINLQRKTLTVRGETSKSKRRREIPINPSLMNHLKEYLQERRNYKTERLLVSSNKDAGLTLHGMKHWVKRIIKISGVKFHMHQFRHTFACNLAQNHIGLPNLQMLMGHTDLRMTQRYLRSLGVEHLIDDILKISLDTSY